MGTITTTFKCKDDNHEFEWKDWSTSVYLLGYWVCKNCEIVKFKWQDWETNKER